MALEIFDAAFQCGVSTDDIQLFINNNWINPKPDIQILFDQSDLLRIQFIAELKINLGVNNESVPIILHLVDQLNRLHLELS